MSLRVSDGSLDQPARLRVRERRPRGTGDHTRSAAGSGGASKSAELLARRQTASEHVVGVVRELGGRAVRGREVDAVLLADAPGGSLSDLIARRTGLAGGEAATVLLGVAGGIAALHEAGWASPSVTAEGVVFTADGCPALDRLDELVELDGDAAVADAEAYHAFARALCLRVVDGTGMRLLAAVEGALRTGRWAAVEEGVTAAARPVSVRLDAGDGVANSDPERGRRVGGDGPVASSREAAGAVGGASRGVVDRAVGSAGARAGVMGGSRGVRADPGSAGRRERAVARVAGVMQLLDGDPVGAVRSWVAERVRRRPALAVAAAPPVALAVALIVLIPGAPASDAAPASSSASGRPGDGAPGAARAGEEGTPVVRSTAGADAGLDADSVATSPVPTSTPNRNPPGSAATTAGKGAPSPADGAAARDQAEKASDLDDPVDAARALVDARHACFSATPASAGCLDGVLEPASGFRAEETAALGGAGAGDERDYHGAQFSLEERWGDAALVAVVPDRSRTPKSEPASLLLVRSEAGWRLRAVFP